MATEPRAFCKEQLFRRLRGQAINVNSLNRYKGNLDTWNEGPGSQNWPRVARAALYSPEDLQWLADLASQEQSWGSWSREFGSELYTPDGLAATIAALRFTAEQGLQETSSQLVLYLRHSWALLALCAQPTAKTSTRYDYRGEARTGQGDTRFYTGPSVALAGNREHESVTGQSLCGALLGWALDWPGLQYRRKISDGIPPNTDNAYTWPLKIVEETLRRPFGPGADAAAFGLQQSEREILRRHVQHGSESETLCTWLRPWSIYPGGADATEFTIRRTTEGTQSWISHTFNPNKPGFPVVSLTADGSYSALHPNHWRREGSPPATAEESEGTLRATAEGSTLHQQLFGGELLYEIRWKDQPRLVGPTATAEPKGEEDGTGKSNA
ncbi:MAG: hypothetical protein AAGD01_04685 [Acidobacteriota bacterium]